MSASVYGEFKEFKPLDVAGPLSVQALKNGQVQAANLFSHSLTSSIKANNFVVLDDPRAFWLYNVIPVVSKDKAHGDVADALNAVSAKLAH